LPDHANGLVLEALEAQGNTLVAETYYSMGGGFVVTAAERQAPALAASGDAARCPYPFDSAAAMLRMARERGLSIAAMKCENERSVRSVDEVEQGIAGIWSVMDGCIERGLMQEGELPGAAAVVPAGCAIISDMAALREWVSGGLSRAARRAQPDCEGSISALGHTLR
jgi:L-serine dehydratase